MNSTIENSLIEQKTTVSARNVEAPDALGGLRPGKKTLTRIQDGWQKHELNIRTPGWVWDRQ
jgi:hypothetical protein